MDGQNYLVFHNDSNDSYCNTSANFRGADVGTTFIDLYFASSTSGASTANAYDKIRLTVTATYEEVALEGVMAGFAGSKGGAVTVIADDKNSKYIHERVTAVASITLAAQAITRAPIVTWSAALELTAGQSGVTVVTGDTSAGILTLPAPTGNEGWFADVMINHAQASAATHITSGTNGGFFIGGLTLVDKDSSDKSEHFNSDNDSNDYINLDAATKGNDPGGHLRIVCDGTNFLVSGILVGDGTLGTPFADAES